MTNRISIVIGLILALLLWGLYHYGIAQAGGIVIDNSTTNNPVVEIRTNTITSGLSDEDVSDALATAAAVGSHQFDFSTTKLQGSVTGAFYENEDAISFGVAKRWKRFDNALFHGAYSRVKSDDLWVIGGTFRF